MLESQAIFEPPNGGYGWIVVFGAIIINIFNKSLFSVFGLLYGSFFNSIHVSQSEIALVMNLASFFSSCSAIFTGAILKFYSCRQVSVFACFLTSFGVSLSSFATSAYGVVFTFSIFTGTGLGLLANCTLIAVTSYFTTNKRRAVSISLTGTGIGQIVLPQIVKYLNISWSVQDAILIMGALISNAVIGAILFRPVQKCLVPRNCNETIPLKLKLQKLPKNEETSLWIKFAKTMDLSLLKDSHFLILNFVLACEYARAIDFTLILPFFLQETAMLDKNQAATSLSVLATFDLISRLTFHFITDKFDLSSRRIMAFGMITLGVIKTLMTFLTSYKYILIACSFYGYIRAMVIVNQILSLAEHCTKNYPERYPGALGLNMLFNGISVMIIGQIFGIFRDYFSDFSYTFYFQDAFMLCILSVWLIEHLYQK